MKHLGRWVAMLAVVGLLAACGASKGDGAASPSPTSGASPTTPSGSASPQQAVASLPGGPDLPIPGGRMEVEPAVEPTADTIDGELTTADGQTRTYHLYVPSSVGEGAGADLDPVPLLVALHGGLGSGTQYEENSGYDGLAEANGFIVVYPDGTPLREGGRPLFTWNAGACCGPAAKDDVDDVAFIDQLIDQLEQTYPIDADHVVATGHSNGGMLALRLACELADQVAAVGFQSSALEVKDCDPSRPVSVLQIHGSADHNVPLAGGEGTNAISGVSYPPPMDAAKTLAAADGCPQAGTTVAVRANHDLRVTGWSPCDEDTEVAFVRVEGASHAWMGHATGGSGLTGAPYADLDSSLVIWNFLSQHGRG